VRFEHEGMSLWYGTSDAPAPGETVPAGVEVTITVAVQPADASNKIELLCRTNQGSTETVAAKWLRNDVAGKTQYFRAQFPTFRAGDSVEYIAICHCAGRQVPSPEEANRFTSSFRVTGAETRPTTETAMLRPVTATRSAGGPISTVDAAPRPTAPSPKPVEVATFRQTMRGKPELPAPDDVESDDGSEATPLPTVPPGPITPGPVVTPGPPNIPPNMPPATGNGTNPGSVGGAGAGQHRVEGRIFFDHGQPAERVGLRLYSRGFGGAETLLGVINTDDRGFYALSLDTGGKPANLEVRVMDQQGKEIPISATKFNIGKEEVVNLIAPASVKPLAAEYGRLSDDLKRELGEMSRLAAARENDEQQDLAVLRKATGWDARLIALAAISERLSADADVKLPQEAVYGLLRAGLPSDKLLLAQVEPDVAEQALKVVRDAGIIALSDDQIGQFKMVFTNFANTARLNIPIPGSRSTYGSMFKASGLPQDAQDKFIPIFIKYSGGGARLWDEARKAGLDEAQIGKLQLQGKFAFLAGNIEAMTIRLMQKQIKDPAQLVEQDFHLADAWVTEVFEQAGIPANRRNDLSDADKKTLDELIPTAYTAEKVEDRLHAYTEDMARKVRLSYPSQVVTRLIEKDDKFRLPAAHDATVTLLKNATGQGFRLGETPVATFLKTRRGVLEGIADSEVQTAQAQLEALQRIYQITPSNEAMPVLLSLGITSAYDVTAYPAAEFKGLFEDEYVKIHNQPPERGLAELVSRKAKQVSSMTYNLFTIVKTMESSLPVRGLSAPPEVRESVRNELIKHFPTMESLFGSMDFCECEHCRSALSPAAYLVDLLQFIDPEPGVRDNFLATWKKAHNDQDYPHKDAEGNAMKPYDVLIERRPDLPHIPLSCENTHTTLPYIDIVNEILEYYVANGKLEEKAARDTGEATTAELLAEPQNVIREAYDKLRESRYPLNLPFDLWIETVRQFCNYFETPLDRILETFRPGDDLFAPTQPFDRAGVFMESLGLSAVETAVFTDADPLLNWFELYGFTSAGEARTEATDPTTGQRIDLNSAKALSRRLGATYKEIAEIAQTRFVNPTLSELTLLYKLGVTIQDARFYKDRKPFYEQNKDLIGKERSALDPADQKRFDDLLNKVPNTQKTGWEIVNEVAAFDQRLNELGAAFNKPLNELQTYVENIPFDKILVLADPDAGCSFDLTTLQYADGEKAEPIAFLRINLFVRLWRKLGWSIEETDRALSVFIPQSAPFDENPTNLAKQPLKTALIYMSHLKTLDEKVEVGKQSRLKLLTLWSDIATTGKKPLYAQLFLTRSVLKSGEVEVIVNGEPRSLSVFDDSLGRYLLPAELTRIAEQVRHEVRLQEVKDADKIDAAAFAGEQRISLRYDALGETQYLAYLGVLSDSEKTRLAAIAPSSELSKLLDAAQLKAREFTLIKRHALALQGALGLTADEIGRILTDAGKSLETAELSLPNVSLLYRYGLLAKVIKLSIRELIALKQLSGLDPFKLLHPDPLTTIDRNYPFSQTLRFVEIAEEVKDSGLKIEDLEYLLRHRFDETGKYRPNREGVLVLLKTLSEGIRAIGAEHAAPNDPGALSEETLRQKLGLALPPDVVERLLAMAAGSAEFTATRSGVAPTDQLAPDRFADEPAIREARYNETRGEQKITFRGTLFDAQKTELQSRFAAALTETQKLVFADLLDNVQKQAREFFDNQLKKQKLRLDGEAGFLEDSDFDALFLPLKPFKKILPTDTPQEIDQKLQENIAIEQENQATLRQRRYRIAKAFLPLLQQRLIRQLIVQTLTAYTGSNPALVGGLLSDERLMATPDSKPLLTSFAATGDRGVNAAFFDSADLSGAPQATTPIVSGADTALKDLRDALNNPLPPANSARFEGYLEAPAPGAYRFYIELDKQNAEAELRFHHLPDPVFLNGVAGADNTTLGDQPDEFLELKPAVPYRFSLELKKLGGGGARLLVQGETLPKDGVSQLALYPLSAMVGAEGAILSLTKALQLTQSLGLSEREVRHVLTRAADFGGVNLNQLPTQPVGDTPAEKVATTERFARFLRLAAYARLKRDLAAGTDDLIGVFEANETGAQDKVYGLIARLTRRDDAIVKFTARALVADPKFESERPLARLWEALQIVERFGAPVASLLELTRIISSAATPEQRFEIARDLKEAIKARFEPETWQRVAQPIFDKLRQRQRDALVSHVMRQHGFDRLDQLYEYFLVDIGMEPMAQTSRIRLAIASVQIFIQRCLLNLELKVHPSTINSGRWEWMKRYRVWEANRKIFLFPENWLEPEFRDDKTHLFAELEGALLQGDVSSDLVEDAFLNYLKKLDELARLDIVAMHIEDDPDPACRTLHVFGRTYSQPHKYFYRRYVNQMWTPWEPLTAEIEGDHLAPVVWRDRLYLFWVTFLEKAQQPTGDTTIPDPTKGETILATKKDIEVQLHWSEYIKGEWSTRESNGFDAPNPVRVTGLYHFDSKSVFIHVSKASDAGDESGVYIHLGGVINSAFYLAGRNSAPENKDYNANGPEGAKPENPYSSAYTAEAYRYSGCGSFMVSYHTRVNEPEDPKSVGTILGKGATYTILPCDNNLTAFGISEDAYQNAAKRDAVEAAINSGLGETASLIKPVFYQDNQHILFVEPDVTERTIEEWQEWVTPTPQPEPDWRKSDWWNELVIIPEAPRTQTIPDPRDPRFGFEIDPGALINPIRDHDWLVNPATVLAFDNTLIGPAGQPGFQIFGGEVASAVTVGGTIVNVNPGGGLAAGSAVVIADTGKDEECGCFEEFNVVGNAGFNTMHAKNFDKLNRSGFGAGLPATGRVNR
jgi:hypothetical protein